MKTMTCTQLGGVCDEEFHDETLEGMGQQSKTHAMKMAQEGDQAHIAKMQEMKQGMNDPEAVKKWMSDKQQVFDELPEDQ